MAKKRKKNPFVTYALEDILRTEENRYVIQVGYDLFATDTRQTFSKDMAEHYYMTSLEALTHQLKTGNKKDKKTVKDIFKNFRILPLRFH